MRTGKNKINTKSLPKYLEEGQVKNAQDSRSVSNSSVYAMAWSIMNIWNYQHSSDS